MLSYLCFYNRNKNIEKTGEVDIEKSNVCIFEDNFSEISLKSSFYKNSLEDFYLYYDTEDSIIDEILNSIIQKIENK